MRSFRSELENNVVERDIIELEKKIALHKNGKIDEERFRSLRLARGVYGQRQEGVQMIRIKIPFGKLNARKIRRICSVSEKYSKGRLHITTRQDIQIHHVELEKTPELWEELEKDQITLREACGNTVRNITASETSGIDHEESFDPRPYAEAMFKYFLRNPICQEMGRKFKISFSNNDKDTALSFMHDLGFIAQSQFINGKEIHGFKVVAAGGLGSQSMLAFDFFEFLPADQIISFTEAVLRVFERHGERNRRMKARLKFLVKEIGQEAFRDEVIKEWEAIDKIIAISYYEIEANLPIDYPELKVSLENNEEFELWKKTNVLEQKDGLKAIGIKVRLGDLYIDQARKLADWMEELSGDELTLTINQNVIIRFVEEKTLRLWYKRLKEIGLADVGFNRFSDITACPGTDTCNLGIASSTGLALVLEHILNNEYPQFANNPDIQIKISGCMNACGQHMIAGIGFQGMSMKAPDKRVLPAAQILLGGGRLGHAKGRIADKVIKVPSKKAGDALRVILNDYKDHADETNFIAYYEQQGEKYFYDLLKHLGQIEDIQEDDFIDWGHSVPYIKAIGIGECAGVVIDLVSTLFFESEEKLELAQRSLEEGNYRDSIYHSYAAFVNTAKALLLAEDQRTNSHATIISKFDELFIETKKIDLDSSFSDLVLRLKTEKASETLAEKYLESANTFYLNADGYRKKDLAA
ncbi:MAG: HEPN domain-containing protein [Bacteroidota bacterium]